jgi:hypothetical protein
MVDNKEAIQKMTQAAQDAIAKGQEMFAQSTQASEKYMETVMDYNTSVFKGGEVIARKAYENYVANVKTAMEQAKGLTDQKDMGEYYQAMSKNLADAAASYKAQAEEMASLSAKIMQENAELAKKPFK